MSLLLMSMTMGGLFLAAAMFLIALYSNRAWLAKFAVGGTVVWLIIYGALLFGTSLTSEEKTLSLNEPKEFCGFYLDCHMHAAVADVRRAKTIGGRKATGEFYIITVNIFSDAVRANLALNTVDAHVVDGEGRKYTREIEAESELGPQPSFETEIGPEESFDKEIVFDLPADVRSARLDIRQGFGIDSLIETFLIGDEDSMFHKRTYFDISEQNALTGVK